MLYKFFQRSSSWAPLNIAKDLNIDNEHGYFIAPNKIKGSFPMMECKNSYHIQDRSFT